MATFLKNAVLVDYDPPRVQTGGLRVADGTIASVGPAAVADPGDEVVDCGGAVVLPGLVNGHAHLYSALAPGMPAPPKTPRDFHEILQYVWWRLDRALDAESIEASGVVGALDALRHGTTTVIDHHASPNCIEGSLDTLEGGIARVGLRAVLCYETTNRNGADGARAGLEENHRYAALCHRRRDSRFAAMVGAHASFTIGDQTLEALAELTRTSGLGLHIHVAEDPSDDRFSKRDFDAGAVERLVRVGALEPKAILAHCIHLDDTELALVADSGATIAHNPRSNMNNGVGYARLGAMHNPITLGTDGLGNDMLTEARFACFKGADAHGGVSPQRVIEMLGASARRASAALGVTVGRLEPGAAADLVVTDYVPATPLEGGNLAGHLIFALDSACVREVMIGGVWCLRAGRVCSVEPAEEANRARAAAQSLWRRMAELP